MAHEDAVQDWTPKSGLDVLLMLLYAEEGTKGRTPIKGITRLDKLMFLLSRSEEFEELFKGDYDFVPYNFGPFATELLDDLEALKSEGVVTILDESQPTRASETRDAEVIDEESGEIDETEITWDLYPVETYGLTERGLMIAELLYHNATQQQQERIKSIKEGFNGISLMGLLRYVYRVHPEYTTKSIIKNEVMKET